MPEIRLKRAISLPQLLLYGLGTMVGGGFYALMGKIAGEAGLLAPAAFLTAGLLAWINAFTFAELSSRLPFSAGESRYVEEAFGRRWLSALVGCLVVLTGVVSAGTLAVATVQFIRDLVPVPEAIGIAALVLAMGAVAAWGIGESVTVVVVITFIEVGALIFIVLVEGIHLTELPDTITRIATEPESASWIGVLSGAFLGFYAFIGFEDLVNMAEEVKDVRRTLPRAIVASVALTTLIYTVVSLVAVTTVPPADLAQASTPLAAIVRGTGGHAVTLIIGVSILTGINGALVQIIMASRVAYGMAKRFDSAPRWLADVNAWTRTPLKSTLLMTGIVLLLALGFPLETLARATSSIMLIIFSLLNVALWRIKRRGDPLPEGAREYPLLVPCLGCSACVGILLFQLGSTLTDWLGAGK